MNEYLVTVDVDGKLINMDERDLSVNDQVVIQTGDIVPADLRLVEAKALEIDEFDITGELLPVAKKAGDDVTLYKGSRVVRGAGKGIVVATGDQTEYGRIVKQEWKQSWPDDLRLIDKRHIWLIILYLPAFVIHFVRANDPILVIVLFAVLSLILTLLQNDAFYKHLLLSSAVKMLERTGVQIRDRQALERMAGVNMMCFDKTGVLTTRRMNVKNIVFADRVLEASNELLALEASTASLVKTVCALCHDVLYYEKTELANPIDKTLIAFAQENGVDVKGLLSSYQRIYDKPFDSENRYMACGFEMGDGERVYFAKGDPEVIYKLCNRYRTSTGALGKADFEFWLTIKPGIDAIVCSGDTAIALAYTPGHSDTPSNEYIFLCLLQLENSLQSGVRDTIRQISEKGIRSLLLTGDKAETAVRVGAESGIASGSEIALTGREIARMKWSEVIRQSAYCSVFAGLTPSQKGVLVRQLQQVGHTVAMIGDGPNDGIALKVADVGISFVSNSSPIARRLSDILVNELVDLPVLLERSLTIKRRAEQLKWGRVLLFVVSVVWIYFWAMHQ